MKDDEPTSNDNIEGLPEDFNELTDALMELAQARNIGKDIYASPYNVEKRAKKKGISLFLAEKELIRESAKERNTLKKEADKRIKAKLSKETKRKLGIKGAGRPEGSKNKNTITSQKDFYKQLERFVRSQNQIEEKTTQIKAAKALELGGARQLRRRLKDYGDTRKWQDIVTSLLTNK